MRHPFWLVNTVLLFLFFATLGFIFFFQPKRPRFYDFEPEQVQPVKPVTPKIDVNKIITNDLFGTYSPPLPTPKEPDLVKPIPKPPVPKPIRVPVKTAPKFLEPLQIKLNGIIIGGEESKNIAIIEDTKTKQSKNYKMGDKVVDAQLIRILKNKIILVRSNGQQETVYISEHEAKKEQELISTVTWETTIKKNENGTYSVDPQQFVKRVGNLGNFIDMLHLTSVYHKGKSVGCRIGKSDPNSLAFALGLQNGDIITTINNIPITDTDNRFEVYNTIIKMDMGDKITVKIVRKNFSLSQEYILESLDQETIKPAKGEFYQAQPKSPEEIEAEKRKLFEQKHQLAPTIQEYKTNEKQAMLKPNPHKKTSRRERKKGVLFNKVQYEKRES